jgi:lipoic acid synthetase
VADAIASLGLRHAVVTSVTRDDLEDNGASAFTEVVKRTRAVAPSARIELLVPDMRGERKDLQSIARSGADVIGHNLEVVESIQGAARDPLASYERSLGVLALLANEGTAVTKSSLMLGLGEEPREVSTALRDLRSAGVDIVTIGQYLRPKGGDLPVSRYVTPAEFEEHAAFARSIGFRSVLSGPLVRSSYHASEALEAVKSGG